MVNCVDGFLVGGTDEEERDFVERRELVSGKVSK